MTRIDDVPARDTLSLYLAQACDVSLLGRDEEIALAEAVDAARAAEEALRDNGHHAPEEIERLQTVVEAGQRARDRLIGANLRLVVSIAKEFGYRGVPFLDLIQEGTLGLMTATEKYDLSRGCKFGTYATWWIKRNVRRAVLEDGCCIRVPEWRHTQSDQIKEQGARLEQELGREPTPEEVAEAMPNMTADEIEKIESVFGRSVTISLDRPVMDDETKELLRDAIAAQGPAIDDLVLRGELAECIFEVLETLKPREASVLRMRFGIGENTRPHTFIEIGDKFGVTRQRARQIHKEALRRLRHPMRRRQLESFRGVA